MLKKNDLHDIWQPGSDMKSLSTKKLENIIMYCKQIVIGKSSNDKYIYSPLILLEVLRWKKKTKSAYIYYTAILRGYESIN